MIGGTRSTRWWVAGVMLVLGIVGAVGNAGVASAATKTEKTFGKWLATCVDADNGKRRCTLSQSQINPTTHRALFIVTIGGTKDAQNLGVVVPTGVSVKDGVTLNFSDGAPTTIGYSVCGPRVCYAGTPLDAKMVGTLKGHPKGVANYVLANKKLVQVNLDLASFSDAFAYFLSQLQ